METPKTKKVSTEAIKAAHAQRMAEIEQTAKAVQPIAGLSEATKATQPPAVQGLK